MPKKGVEELDVGKKQYREMDAGGQAGANDKDTGDRLELTNAHREFNKGLKTYASYKVSNIVLGEDLVQDTFIKTWNYIARKGKINGMKAFLYNILNNLIVDEYRKRKHKPTSLDALIDDGFSPGVDNSERFINIMDAKRVVLLIRILPVSYRHVMNLRFIDDLTIKEICVIVGESENTVSVRIHRGVKKMKILCEAFE